MSSSILPARDFCGLGQGETWPYRPLRARARFKGIKKLLANGDCLRLLPFYGDILRLSIDAAVRQSAALNIFSKIGARNGKRIWCDFNHGRSVVRRESPRQTD